MIPQLISLGYSPYPISVCHRDNDDDDDDAALLGSQDETLQIVYQVEEERRITCRNATDQCLTIGTFSEVTFEGD